jgi:hypothetical protein
MSTRNTFNHNLYVIPMSPKGEEESLSNIKLICI